MAKARITLTKAMPLLVATAAQEIACGEVGRPGGVRLEAQNLNLELMAWPLRTRPRTHGYLVGLEEHRQVLNQHVRDVMRQGLRPTIVLRQREPVGGDPVDDLVVVEVARQVDRSHAHRPLQWP